MRRALVYGSNGALGRALITSLKTRDNPSWTTYGVDIGVGQNADKNFAVPRDLSMDLSAQAKFVGNSLQEEVAQAGGLLDVVVCVSGGFAMASAQDASLFETVNGMYGSSVFPSFVAANLAALYLKKGGLLVLPGAAVGGDTPTPWGLAYGSSKAAVHHMVRSLGTEPMASGFDATTKVVGFAPVTLDTPGNREAMPDVDRSTWTPLSVLAEKLTEWAENPALCTSGVVYKVVTTNRQQTTMLEPIA